MLTKAKYSWKKYRKKDKTYYTERDISSHNEYLNDGK